MMGRPPRGHPPKPPRVTLPRTRDHRDVLKRRSLELIRKIEDKDKYGIFLEPVNADEVPGYSDIITRPMDLSTVRKSITVGVYRNPAELRADIDLIWSNCIKFNADGSIYYREAVRLRALAGKYFEEFLRILSRDGLPYGPRRNGAAHGQQPSASLAASSAQLKAAAAASLQTPAQRLRNIARARRKALLDAGSQAEPTEAERAAVEAAAKLLPNPEKEQIYEGPYQCLRRFPNTPPGAAFPYVRGTAFHQRLQPLPPAWCALGRWRQPGPQQSSILNRDREFHFAQRYQNYINNAAPVARRLLATILDPLVVVEHDEKVEREQAAAPHTAAEDTEKIAPDVHVQDDPVVEGTERANAPNTEEPVGAVATLSPKKRPRHGDMQELGFEKHALLSEVHLKEIVGPSYAKDIEGLHLNSRKVEPPSPSAVQELRNALKAHNIDDSFLSTILNSSNNSQQNSHRPPIGKVKDAETPNTQRAPAKSSSETSGPMDIDSGSVTRDVESRDMQQKKLELKWKSAKPFLVSPPTDGSPTDVASPEKSISETPLDDDKDESACEEANDVESDECASESGSDNVGEDSASEIESIADTEERDAELENLLKTNHATLLNVLRVRALRETAIGDALKDLKAEEEAYAAMLREGVALAASKMPPNLLISREQVAEVALCAAKQTVERTRKRKEPPTTLETKEKRKITKKLATSDQVVIEKDAQKPNVRTAC